MGIDLGEWRQNAGEGLWGFLLPALEAFLLVATQWRVAGTTERVWRTGLDYAACRDAWALAGMEVGPELFGDVRGIERGALEAWAEARG